MACVAGSSAHADRTILVPTAADCVCVCVCFVTWMRVDADCSQEKGYDADVFTTHESGPVEQTHHWAWCTPGEWSQKRKQEKRPTAIELGSLSELRDELQRASVDTSEWGVGSAKSIDHLWKEIEANESSLHRTQDGRLRRALEFVEVELSYNGRILIETHHEVDGRVRQKFCPLSQKMRAGEDWQARTFATAHTLIAARRLLCPACSAPPALPRLLCPACSAPPALPRLLRSSGRPPFAPPNPWHSRSSGPSAKAQSWH